MTAYNGHQEVNDTDGELEREKQGRSYGLDLIHDVTPQNLVITPINELAGLNYRSEAADLIPIAGYSGLSSRH